MGILFCDILFVCDLLVKVADALVDKKRCYYLEKDDNRGLRIGDGISIILRLRVLYPLAVRRNIFYDAVECGKIIRLIGLLLGDDVEKANLHLSYILSCVCDVSKRIEYA